MFCICVLVTALLCYGTIDLLLRAVYAVLFFGEKTKRCLVFFLTEPKDLESVVLRIQFERFFLPKEPFWVVVDDGVGEEERPFCAQFCEQKGVFFCSREEFIKLAENGLHSADKLL